MVVFLALASFLPSSTRAPSTQLKGFFSQLRVGEDRIQFFKAGAQVQTTYYGILETSYLTSLSPCFLIHKMGMMISTSQSWEMGPDIDFLHMAHLSWRMSVPPPHTSPSASGLNTSPRAGAQCSEPLPQTRSTLRTPSSHLPSLIPEFLSAGPINILSGAVLQGLSHPF